jgi:hypothetical protein
MMWLAQEKRVDSSTVLLTPLEIVTVHIRGCGSEVWIR